MKKYSPDESVLFHELFPIHIPILAGSNGSGRSMVPPVEMEVNLIRERWNILICSDVHCLKNTPLFPFSYINPFPQPYPLDLSFIIALMLKQFQT